MREKLRLLSLGARPSPRPAPALAPPPATPREPQAEPPPLASGRRSELPSASAARRKMFYLDRVVPEEALAIRF